MTDLSQDPIINVVHNGIKRGIRVTLDNECYGSAVVLILSGIDTMAYLNMSENQQEVKPQDFINWCEKYIKFPCKEQLTGLDLYGARCSMLHQYGSQSKLSRKGECRQIGYMDKSVPEIVYNPQVSKDVVMVSIRALSESFFNGIDKFMIDLFSDTAKAKIAEKRFETIVHTSRYRNNTKI